MFTSSKSFAATILCAFVALIGCLAPSVAHASAPGVKLLLPTWTVGFTSIGTVSVAVTATPTGGVQVPANASGASVALVSALPAGVTASWSQPTVNSSGVVNWTLTFTGSTAAVASSETLTVSTSITDSGSGNVYSSSSTMAVQVTFVAPTLKSSPSSTQVTLSQGMSITDTFTLTGGGSFHGPVSLAVSGLPSGVTASWSSTSLNLGSGNVGSSILTLTAAASTPANWYNFAVQASGDGLALNSSYTLIIQKGRGVQIAVPTWTVGMTSTGTTAIAISATPLGGLTVAGPASASATIVSGLPTGITASWSQPTVSSASVANWTLTLTGSAAAVASSGTLTVAVSLTDAGSGTQYTASQGFVTSVSLAKPTLSIAGALTNVPILQGATATDLFTITTGGSFNGPVTLSLSGLPAGVTGSWSSGTVTPVSGAATSTLTLTASSSATVNWYGFTITASGDGVSVPLNYVVEVEPSNGLSLVLAQPTVSIQPGGTATLTITGQPHNGVVVEPGAAGATIAITSTLPDGVTASWSNATLTTTGAVTWVLTLTAASTVAGGSDPFHVSGRIVDKVSGLTFSSGQDFPLLVSILATVSIGSTPGLAVPTSFLGLSHEWGDAQRMMGSNSTGINTIYRQLLNNLTAYGSGPMFLRIGGNSTDTRGEPIAGYCEPFAEVATALGARFSLGLSLGPDDVNLAVDQATAYLQQMPVGTIKDFEIGNEPDFYVQLGYRPSTYSMQDYYADFTTWSQHITPILPSGVSLMGSSWAKINPTSTVSAFQSSQTGTLALFSQHFYVTTPADLPSNDFLLTPSAATSGPTQVADAITLSHSNGLIYRMGETSSITGAGVAGVSDAFESALWSMDTMFGYLAQGADGVNWEASNGNSDIPFTFTTTTAANGISTYALLKVNPIYYGMLLFEQATAKNSQMLPVQVSTSANLTAWSTVDASGTTRLLLINKDENSSGTVTVTSGTSSTATVVRLLAPSYQSTSGVTIGGQTFDGSPDGTLQGAPTNETIEGNNGVFQIPIGITSAALITFSN